MDTHVANGPISNSYHCSSESAEINIDNIVTAVAKLNVRILRLREEIVAFKNENMVSSVLTHNSLRYDQEEIKKYFLPTIFLWINTCKCISLITLEYVISIKHINEIDFSLTQSNSPKYSYFSSSPKYS